MFQLSWGRMCHLKCQWKRSFPVFFSILAVFSLFDLHKWGCQRGGGGGGGGGIFNPDRLLSGENETIYSPMICWHAVAGSPDNHGDKDSDAYPLIPWFFFCFFRPSGFSPIIAQPNKGGEALERSWQVEKCESTCVLVLWRRRAGNITAVWRNMTAYKTSSEFSMWQIASVCAPRPHPTRTVYPLGWRLPKTRNT